MRGGTRRGIVAAAVVALGGCTADSYRRAEAVFDLGPQTVAATVPVPVAGVDVVAPLWLAGSAMQYRLLYADPARRFDYAESRWIAPPDELVKRSFELAVGANGSGACRLRVDLSEFAQVFDSPTDSRFVLEGQATLVVAREGIARHAFSVSLEAPSADARGGVAAATNVVRRAARDLAVWLGGMGDRCRGGSA